MGSHQEEKTTNFLIKYKHYHKLSIEIIAQTSADRKYKMGSETARKKKLVAEKRKKKMLTGEQMM